MRLLAGLRGALSLLAVLVWLIGPGALMLYLFVVPAGALAPARRRALVSAYMRLMSRGILALLRLGGARFERNGTIDTREACLVVMNHQSLLDVPTLCLMSWPHVPSFVTRLRYARFVPVVSTCVRLVGSPVVDPRRDARGAVEALRRGAAAQDHGVTLFPEGHRSRDGGVRPFKTAGAVALLEARPMPVWLLATDGFWSSRRLVDFVFHVGSIRGRTQVLERCEAPRGEEPVRAFLEEARGRIVSRLEAMRGPAGAAPPALLDALRSASAPLDEDAVAAAGALAEAGGGEVEAVLFFGSRKSGARPSAESAFDFFVVARDEARLYRSLARAGLTGRPAWLLSALGRVLPPTSIALRLPGAAGPVLVKAAVARREVFERETSTARRDHFIAGRLFQPVDVVYARDAAAGDHARGLLASAQALTWSWVRPWLPERFGPEEYARTLLRVSFAGEVRPEPVERRVQALWEAQQAALAATYRVLLRELARQGELSEAEGGYQPLRPVGRVARLRRAVWFRWSMARATARWAKHVLSFEGWLDFLVRKARRHSGREIELSERERRAPLIFLWPRVWRYLREKDR